MSDQPNPAGATPIDPGTTIGALCLAVADLERALGFYTTALGMRLHRREGDTAVLGAGQRDLLTLVEQPGARPARRVTGLYHFALLYPGRRELARALAHLAAQRIQLQGMSDHAVSEAIYLADPDGNGIEIYRDRPRSEWPHMGRQVRMTVDPLDLDGLLAEIADDAAPRGELPAATVVGHMHLHVAHLEPARRFYCETLGLELMQRFGDSAEFVAAGGYHHHLGYNTWAGVGAPPPAADMAGLRWFELRLPSDAALAATLARVTAAGLALDRRPAGLWGAEAPLLRDPSGNAVVLTV